MKKVFKKIAVVLAMAMVFAAMPMSAFAATPVTTFDELKNAVATGGDVVLGADIEITTTIVVNTDVNLDLNGYTLTGPHNYVGGTNLYAFNVAAGTLTLDDTSAAQTGKIACKYSGIQTKGGTFVMNGGKIVAADASMAVAVVNYGGSVVINDGVIEAYDTAVTTMAYFTPTATTKVNGGEITLISSANNYALFEVGGQYNTGSTDVAINAGTLDSNGKDVLACDDSNGTVAAEVSGGTFTTAPADEYIAAGKVFDPATGVVGAPAPAATEAPAATGAHVWGYNTQFDAAAHWDYCHVCGAQNTPVAHSDANGDGICECGWILASTPSRVNPNTGVTAEMLA